MKADPEWYKNDDKHLSAVNPFEIQKQTECMADECWDVLSCVWWVKQDWCSIFKQWWRQDLPDGGAKFPDGGPGQIEHFRVSPYPLYQNLHFRCCNFLDLIDSSK